MKQRELRISLYQLQFSNKAEMGEMTRTEIWAGSVVVSHAYVHLVGFDTPVQIGCLLVKPGDLLLADRHGVIQIPLEIAREIPKAVRQVEVRERTIIQYCQSPEFSADGLADLVARL
jgi:regulator of RNase E activity RraA